MRFSRRADFVLAANLFLFLTSCGIFLPQHTGTKILFQLKMRDALPFVRAVDRRLGDPLRIADARKESPYVIEGR